MPRNGTASNWASRGDHRERGEMGVPGWSVISDRKFADGFAERERLGEMTVRPISQVKFGIGVALALLGLGACGDREGQKATLYKSNRVDGGWERIATFYGFADNQAGCDEIAQVLNRHGDEFSGTLKNEWRCVYPH